MEKLNNEKTGEGEGIIYLIVMGLIIWGIFSLFGFNGHNTLEGDVSFGDCRETIYLETNDWSTYFGSFIGYTQKTEKGKIMGGTFVRIVNDKSFFGSSPSCARAYIYDKKQDSNSCTNPEYPYLTYDDMCSKIKQ